MLINSCRAQEHNRRCLAQLSKLPEIYTISCSRRHTLGNWIHSGDHCCCYILRRLETGLGCDKDIHFLRSDCVFHTQYYIDDMDLGDWKGKDIRGEQGQNRCEWACRNCRPKNLLTDDPVDYYCFIGAEAYTNISVKDQIRATTCKRSCRLQGTGNRGTIYKMVYKRWRFCRKTFPGMVGQRGTIDWQDCCWKSTMKIRHSRYGRWSFCRIYSCRHKESKPC